MDVSMSHYHIHLDPLVEQSEQNILIDGITDFNIIKSQVNGITIFCEKPSEQNRRNMEMNYSLTGSVP